ncbi:alpha/beta hydrolase [Oribacterium sp. NK2B42]|uniref:alpha/beta hydrolase n=1 Tax=Oribacterium sp. NK2B42 TaxID=689781 RepID=UPI0003FC5E94|nr:alpha/beta hydrolase [Oribacterium sp. NK2B42]MBO6310150.1 alpha/beta hydrolase [Oribacterium sp.]
MSENNDALSKVREGAHGLEPDQELIKEFPLKRTYEKMIPREGEEAVKVYIYEPEGMESKGPVLIRLHGGGFVKPYRGQDVNYSHVVAYNTKCLLIDVDYKPAPEKAYPYAVNEGYAVVKYVYEHAEEFDIDPERIILSGASAGANMATVITLMNHEKELKGENPDFKICRTCLAYPPLDLAADPVSKLGPDATPESIELQKRGLLYNEWYAGGEDRTNWRVSPVYAKQELLVGLNPFLVCTGGTDSLGPEGEKFAAMLIQAGVSVTCKRLLGTRHGFLTRRVGIFGEAEKLYFDMVEEVKHPKHWKY